MSPTLQLAALAALLFTLVGSCLCAVFYRTVRGRLASFEPAARARALYGLSAGPLVLSLTLTVTCFLPSALALIGWSTDHCPLHGGHPHLCLLHPAGPLDGRWIWPLLAAAGLLATGIAPQIARLWRAHRLQGALLAFSQHDATLDVQVVDADRPLALTVGTLRPRVVLSSHLGTALTPQVLHVVVAHERAHVHRRDTLWQTLAALFSLAYPPRVRRQLLADLTLACEQACDEAAARAVGDRLRVAETLLAVERLFHASPSVPRLAGAAFGDSSLAERVHALLTEPRDRTARHPTWRWIAALTSALLASTLLAAEPLHHLTETVLGLLTR